MLPVNPIKCTGCGKAELPDDDNVKWAIAYKYYGLGLHIECCTPDNMDEFFEITEYKFIKSHLPYYGHTIFTGLEYTA